MQPYMSRLASNSGGADRCGDEGGELPLRSAPAAAASSAMGATDAPSRRLRSQAAARGVQAPQVKPASATTKPPTMIQITILFVSSDSGAAVGAAAGGGRGGGGAVALALAL